MQIRPDQLYPERGGTATRRPIDVRSPAEVAKGALPGARAIPILDDQERHAVGLRYAQDGQEAAVAVGEAVTAEAMPARAAAWRTAADATPSAFMCWRGGLRSELAQRYADRPDTPRIEGGYKAVRAHLTGSLPASLARRSSIVVTGVTGSGKTELITAAGDMNDLLALDLEAAAGHRGSAFGSLGPQPAQATFEHRLLVPLLLGRESLLLLEDESRNIGRVHLPNELHDVMRTAPLLILEAPMHERLQRIHRDYIAAPAHIRGETTVLNELTTAVSKLRRRLGGAATDAMIAVLNDAHAQHAWNERDAFRGFIEPLLTDYYDPAYRKATPTDGRHVLARGTHEELLTWLTANAHPSPA